MLSRCYLDRPEYATYKDCEVCDEWLKFSNFYNYCQENKQWLDLGYQLDKDLLIKNNKIYSPETCLWLPNELNTLLTYRRKDRGNYPVGVSKHNQYFKAQLSTGNSNRTLLGYFKTPEEAFEAYKKAKENHIKFKAEEYKDIISDKTYQALINYVVNMTD